VTNEKPICSLSLDLDNQWSYMKTHGDVGWESFPSYLDLVVPRFLNILDDFGWKITVFVVGQDAALEKSRESLQMIADAGHEIGNHSFNHEPWLHLYSRQQVEEEIVRTEETIEAVTGLRTRGFRGPGYSLSREVLEVLAQREYHYDASTFPTFLGPLARAYYFLRASLSEEEKSERRLLFGRFHDGFQPLRPYRWDLRDHSLIEIPVTTLPILKIPFHFSYILFLASTSTWLARMYFRTSLTMCRLTRVPPSLLLHPLDFLGKDDAPDLRFFPGMNLHARFKTAFLRSLFRSLEHAYDVVEVSLFGRAACKKNLPIRQPPQAPIGNESFGEAE
jgi:hypothetical protein